MAYKKHCFCCDKEIDTSPFANMDAAGESTISRVEIYDCNLTLCSKCTWKLWKFLKGLQDETEKQEQKPEKTSAIKARKIVKLSKYMKIK